MIFKKASYDPFKLYIALLLIFIYESERKWCDVAKYGYPYSEFVLCI